MKGDSNTGAELLIHVGASRRFVVCGRGVNESSYLSSTHKILKFRLEVI